MWVGLKEPRTVRRAARLCTKWRPKEARGRAVSLESLGSLKEALGWGASQSKWPWQGEGDVGGGELQQCWHLCLFSTTSCQCYAQTEPNQSLKAKNQLWQWRGTLCTPRQFWLYFRGSTHQAVWNCLYTLIWRFLLWWNIPIKSESKISNLAQFCKAAKMNE